MQKPQHAEYSPPAKVPGKRPKICRNAVDEGTTAKPDRLADVTFTSLHRVLGRQPGEPIDTEMLAELVARQVPETDDLDFKRDLSGYEAKGLELSDFPKDVAAMANSGGGLIICGIQEEHGTGKALQQVDVGDVTEVYERALRSAAIRAITPSVYGVRTAKIGTAPPFALLIEVPPSLEVPHFIYLGKDEEGKVIDPQRRYLAAPRRNGPDTTWLTERQIEQMYRSRINESGNADEELQTLYTDMADQCPTNERAYMIGVVRPRIPSVIRPKRDLKAVLNLLENAMDTSWGMFADRATPYDSGPLSHAYLAATNNGRSVPKFAHRDKWHPTLRGWLATTMEYTEGRPWLDAKTAIYDNGATVLAVAVGGKYHWPGKQSDEPDAPGNVVFDIRFEQFVSDLTALASANLGTTPQEVDIRAGMEWTGDAPIMAIRTNDNFKPVTSWDNPSGGDDGRFTISRYRPVRAGLMLNQSPDQLLRETRDFALDVINQAGLQYLTCLRDPDEPPRQITML